MATITKIALRNHAVAVLDSGTARRIFFPSETKAKTAQTVLYRIRSGDRFATRKIYPPTDRNHGASQFDQLMFSIQRVEKEPEDSPRAWALVIQMGNDEHFLGELDYEVME